MKTGKRTVCCLLAATILGLAWAAAFAQDDIGEHRNCAGCGMDRKAYGYSRVMIHYQDGANVGVCSLHCAAVELDRNPDRPVKIILVADRDTRTLVEAGKATWVIGGRKRGVMTGRPKWAFETKAAAETFITANGGEMIPWSRALEAAREELAESPSGNK